MNIIPPTSAVNPSPAAMDALAVEPTPPGEVAEPDRPSLFPSRKCQQAIHDAVTGLLSETERTGERRWSPRLPFVRPGWIFIEQPDASGSEPVRPIAVVTTDISLEGTGVLCSREIEAEQVLLQLSGSRFACDIRWSTNLDNQIYRYGLRFLSVLDMPLFVMT